MTSTFNFVLCKEFPLTRIFPASLFYVFIQVHIVGFWLRAKSKGSATPQLSEKDRKELQDADLPERQPLKGMLLPYRYVSCEFDRFVNVNMLISGTINCCNHYSKACES